jgi:hypothetical protein
VCSYNLYESCSNERRLCGRFKLDTEYIQKRPIIVSKETYHNCTIMINPGSSWTQQRPSPKSNSSAWRPTPTQRCKKPRHRGKRWFITKRKGNIHWNVRVASRHHKWRRGLRYACMYVSIPLVESVITWGKRKKKLQTILLIPICMSAAAYM